jgi:hypothetical protein
LRAILARGEARRPRISAAICQGEATKPRDQKTRKSLSDVCEMGSKNRTGIFATDPELAYISWTVRRPVFVAKRSLISPQKKQHGRTPYLYRSLKSESETDPLSAMNCG